MELNTNSIIIGTVLIILTYFSTTESMSILPFMIIIGILVGLMNNKDIQSAAVNTLIPSVIGVIVSSVISLGLIAYLYGQVYLISMVSFTIVYAILYIILGTAGGIIGYYIYDEIKN